MLTKIETFRGALDETNPTPSPFYVPTAVQYIFVEVAVLVQDPSGGIAVDLRTCFSFGGDERGPDRRRRGLSVRAQKMT